MFSSPQIMRVTGHTSVQSFTVHQKTDMDEKIAMGQTVGRNLINDLVKKIPAFPSTLQLALPLPQDTNEYSLEPFLQDNSSTILSIQASAI